MNDELNAQLTAIGYKVPSYLRDKLTVVTDSDSVRAEGDSGLFTLTVPAQTLDLYTGGEDGMALAQFRWQPDSLDWDGAVQVGGAVETLTIMEVGDMPITVLTVLGAPLVPGALPYAPVGATLPHEPPTFEDGIMRAEEQFYTFLAPEDSSLVTLAENALMGRLRVWFVGRLADEAAGWHTVFALPILLERGTVFAGL